jgi:5-(carboxyamino)imidazole ribonucleotide synthase
MQKKYLCKMENVWYGESFKLGVLGGGQLGRMLIQSAISYDVRVFCMDASYDFPCAKIAHGFTVGDINDFDEVLAFGSDKDVVTVEIEHVNVDALEVLEKRGVKVFPQPSVLRMIQDKGAQKEFYQKNNIPTAPFRLVNSRKELMEQNDFLPFVQKMRKGGYDGKGVFVVPDQNHLEKAFDVPSVVEQFVDFVLSFAIP